MVETRKPRRGWRSAAGSRVAREAAPVSFLSRDPLRAGDRDWLAMQRGELAMAISNRVVSLISEYIGRGPTRARTYVHDDLISVVVRDTLTKGEQLLVASGKSEL